MYSKVKSCIHMNNEKTDYFVCNTGLRQGENLSPLLFALYINDMESFFTSRNVTGLQSCTETILQQINVYVKLMLLFYADDTVIVAESAESLQYALDVFNDYCNEWKLNVNPSKTKCMIFSKRKPRHYPLFYYDGAPLEVVENYNYLGLFINYNVRFTVAKRKLVEQATKAMYSVFKYSRRLQLPPDLQLKLFDSLVCPILLYCCEVWGYEKVCDIEKVHLTFCKRILCVKRSTSNCMVYGELGRTPLQSKIDARCISYWMRIIYGKQEKLCAVIYKFLLELYNNNIFTSQWLRNIKSILDRTGNSNIWLLQYNDDILVNRVWLCKKIERTVNDQYIAMWKQEIDLSSKTTLYKWFKTDFVYEKYLNMLSTQNRIVFTRFRLSNHKLPIETGRWNNVPRDERYCNLCNGNHIGDEYHFILECTAVADLRYHYLPRYYCLRPYVSKFCDLMSSDSRKTLNNLCIYIREASKTL